VHLAVPREREAAVRRVREIIRLAEASIAEPEVFARPIASFLVGEHHWLGWVRLRGPWYTGCVSCAGFGGQ